MPLFRPSTDPKAPVNPVPPIQQHQSVAVDSKLQPRNQLLTHIEGSRWIVNYYSQILTVDSEPTSQELNRPQVYQQYVEILRFELKVTDTLSASQEQSNAEMTYVGAATLYPCGVIPNVHDLFTADIGDGRLGLFQIDSVEQRSVMRDSTWSIRYSLLDYLDIMRADDLQRKVSKRTTFVRDLLTVGKSPILVQSELLMYQQLIEWLHKIPDIYFAEFYDREFATFMIPDQLVPTYDPYVVKFLSEIISPSRHPEYLKVNVLNADTGRAKQIYTIWDSLLERSEHVMDYGITKIDLQSTKTRYHRPRFGSVAYGKIAAVIQPQGDLEPFGAVLKGSLTPSKPRQFSRPPELEQVIIDHTLDGLMTVVDPNGPEDIIPPQPMLIHPASGDHYVFSEHFYNRVYSETSILERLTTQYLKRLAMPQNSLLQLCKASMAWGQVERFYFLPILYVLVAASVGDIN